MKVALCLYGYFDSFTDHTSKGMDGYEHIKKNIFDKTDTDVFIHSWQPDLEDFLVDLYKPKKLISEPQIDFSPHINERNLDPTNFWNSIGRPPEFRFSYFYSLSQSFKLVREYELKTGEDYDIVIKGRFDLGRINRNTSGPGKHCKHAVQCINFDPSLDMNKLYVADWDSWDDGICDMWWYSNSENMRKFANLYEKCYTDYWNIGSDYYNSLEHKSDVLNAIRSLKQFLIDNDLWEKVQPLQTTWE